MSGRPSIPGGPTDRIAKAGGEQLARELMIQMGGRELPTIVYALTRVLSSVCLHRPTLPEATELAQTIAGDAVNELELNWPDRERLFAEARASLHTGSPGHG